MRTLKERLIPSYAAVTHMGHRRSSFTNKCGCRPPGFESLLLRHFEYQLQ
ncbi:MAG TPA: hypothetical protein PKG58_01790 [Bacillota bacterium]|nr:hypothetical protein [Bacillota bacterium]